MAQIEYLSSFGLSFRNADAVRRSTLCLSDNRSWLKRFTDSASSNDRISEATLTNVEKSCRLCRTVSSFRSLSLIIKIKLKMSKQRSSNWGRTRKRKNSTWSVIQFRNDANVFHKLFSTMLTSCMRKTIAVTSSWLSNFEEAQSNTRPLNHGKTACLATRSRAE